jgi:hypothetical protein
VAIVFSPSRRDVDELHVPPRAQAWQAPVVRLHESNGRRLLEVLGRDAVVDGGEFEAGDFLGRVLLGLAFADAHRDAYLYDRLHLLLRLAEWSAARGYTITWSRD